MEYDSYAFQVAAVKPYKPRLMTKRINVDNRTQKHLPLTGSDVALLPAGLVGVPINSREGVIGFFAIDADDLRAVSALSWSLVGAGGRRYVRASTPGPTGEREHTTAHRFVLGLTLGDGKEVDHIDGNPFHNWRSNLRLCDRSANMHNRAAFSTSKSGIKGVCWMPKQRLWCAYLNVKGKRLHTSYHKEQAPAALARLSAEVTHGVRSLQPATTHAEGLAS